MKGSVQIRSNVHSRIDAWRICTLRNGSRRKRWSRDLLPIMVLGKDLPGFSPAGLVFIQISTFILSNHFLVCVCAQVSGFHEDLIGMGLGTIQLYNGLTLILTSTVADSRSGQVLGSWGLWLLSVNLEGESSTRN